MMLKHLEPGDGIAEYRMANGDSLCVQAGVTLEIDEAGARWLLTSYPQAFAPVETGEAVTDGN